MFSNSYLKLGDFGVSKVLKTNEQLARTQVGTPYYVAPEVWRNKPCASMARVPPLTRSPPCRPPLASTLCPCCRGPPAYSGLPSGPERSALTTRLLTA